MLTRQIKEPEFKKIPAMTIHEFREVTPFDELDIPELPENRKCTNFSMLVVFFTFIGILIALSTSIFLNKGPYRWWYGYDSCGNLCGYKNIKVPKVYKNCTPVDYTDYPVVLYGKEARTCIKKEDCDTNEYKVIFGRCYPIDVNVKSKLRISSQEQTYFETLDDIGSGKRTVIIMVVFTWVVVVIVYICFRISSRVTLAFFVITMTSLYTIATIGFWTTYFQAPEDEYLITCVLSILHLVGFLIFLFFFRKHFTMTARLYKESVKIIFKAPSLLIHPLITIFSLFVFSGLIVYLLLVLYTRDGKYNPTLRVFNTILITFVTYWFFAFVNGCQCMIVGGVVGAYFFTRDNRPSHRFPYFKSLWNTMYFHLGSVTAGSLFITILRIIRPLSERIERDHRNCCLRVIGISCEWVREMSEYFTRKAYIMTALHGRGFLRSGKRSVRLYWLFLCDLILTDQFACIFMHAISFFIMFCALVLGIVIIMPLELTHFYVPILIGTCLAGTVTFFYVSVMNVVIETLFICFCEDRLLNTGSRHNPFYMPPELHSVMVDALAEVYRENRARSNSD